MILGKYKRVQCQDLKAKAQEAYNFQKASAALAKGDVESPKGGVRHVIPNMGRYEDKK